MPRCLQNTCDSLPDTATPPTPPSSLPASPPGDTLFFDALVFFGTARCPPDRPRGSQHDSASHCEPHPPTPRWARSASPGGKQAVAMATTDSCVTQTQRSQLKKSGRSQPETVWLPLCQLRAEICEKYVMRYVHTHAHTHRSTHTPCFQSRTIWLTYQPLLRLQAASWHNVSLSSFSPLHHSLTTFSLPPPLPTFRPLRLRSLHLAFSP